MPGIGLIGSFGVLASERAPSRVQEFWRFARTALRYDSTACGMARVACQV